MDIFNIIYFVIIIFETYNINEHWSARALREISWKLLAWGEVDQKKGVSWLECCSQIVYMYSK